MATRGEKSGPHDRKSEMDAKPQTAEKHPGGWARDPNANRTPGKNLGPRPAEQERALRSAFDVKELYASLSDFTDDELKSIPVIPEGQRLQQGGIYIDLSEQKRREFTATGDMVAGPRNLYTSKSEVPYALWNRLMGVENGLRNPERKRSIG
jgi:hypothetical protein